VMMADADALNTADERCSKPSGKWRWVIVVQAEKGCCDTDMHFEEFSQREINWLQSCQGVPAVVQPPLAISQHSTGMMVHTQYTGKMAQEGNSWGADCWCKRFKMRSR
jgi:hypothetical protein